MEHTCNPVKVYAGRVEKYVVSRTSNKSSNITLMACVNGAGDRMPPCLSPKAKPNGLFWDSIHLKHLTNVSGAFSRME
jgi:hypothetical protein